MLKMLNPSTDKILIGIPTIGTVDWQFASSVALMQYPCPSIFMWTIRTMIDEARNMIIRHALKDGSFTHVLMMDDDQTFDPDALIKLYNHDVDVCSALVFQRKHPYMPCVYKYLPDGFHPFFAENFSQIDGCGTGFVLFKTDVFNKIPSPWFETYYDSDGEHWSVDLDFSKKMLANNIKMFCDPNITVNHLGDKEIVSKEFVNNKVKEGKIDFVSKEEIEKLKTDHNSGIIK